MTTYRTQEELLGAISTMMEAHGWHKEWVNISTAGMILVRWSKGPYEFTMSLDEMEISGQVLPDTSDIFVD